MTETASGGSTAATGLALRLGADEEFADVPRAVLEAEVAVAARELDGQVPSGSAAELLHRLVVCRLRQREHGGW